MGWWRGGSCVAARSWGDTRSTGGSTVGRLHLVHRGRVRGRPSRALAARPLDGRRARVWREGAVLSHQLGGGLWGIAGRRARSSHRRDRAEAISMPRPALHPHRAVLPADEVTVLDGIPTTTPARTLLDLAAVVPEARAGASARRGRDPPAPRPITTLLDRYPATTRRGHPPSPPPHQPQSNPNPNRARGQSSSPSSMTGVSTAHAGQHHRRGTYEVDAVWREARLIVELDGFATHGTRRGFERDRKRDRQLAAAGWRVIRLTWWQLSDEEALARELRALLGFQPRRTSSASPWPPPPHMVATPSVAPVRRI